MLLSAAILCVGLAMSPAGAEYIQNNGSRIQTQRSQTPVTRPMIFAGSPAVCQANYNQCVRGCDGFPQCVRQCQINYNGCLR
jgi:hypothetical protein